MKHEFGHRCDLSHFIDIPVCIVVNKDDGSWHFIFFVAVL